MKVVANEYAEKEVIKILREWTELKQSEFAKSLGKSTITIQSYERGVRRFNFETLMKIARKYNLTVTIEKKKK